MHKENTSGVTLVALTVTIIVLAILVGISLNVVVGDNGLINRAKKVSDDADQVKAKEKLQLELANLSGDKISDKSYNEEDYINNRLIGKDMRVYEDYVIVDGWLFEIDRSEPKIKNELGQGTINEDIKINPAKTVDANFDAGTIKATVVFNKGKIATIKIGGQEISFTDNGAGTYIGSLRVTNNGTYNIVAVDTKGNLQFANVSFDELTSDMEIYTKEDMEEFKTQVKSGRTFEGKSVKMMADVDLGLAPSENWEPIDENFKGTFYGNNYEIKNLYINETSSGENKGLFGVLNEKASVKDIVIESGEIKSNGDKVGAIAGTCNGNIENCKNNINISGNSLIGGIVGVLTGNAEYIINYGEVIGSGGDVGGCVGNLTGNIKFGFNGNNISGGYRIGGISGGSSIGNILYSCNIGIINSLGATGGGNSAAGGIIGAFTGIDGECNIFDCCNYGNIFGKNPEVRWNCWATWVFCFS